MIFDYTPKGVCSKKMRVTLDDQNVIEKVEVLGGCSGNLQGISSLVVGMPAQEAIRRADALMADYPAVLSRLKDKSAAMARAAGENERLLLEMLEQHRMH